MSVVNRFLKFEFDDHIRTLLRKALDECESPDDPVLRSFDFNVYIVTLDSQKATAKVEDILDPSDDGEEIWPLKRFAEVIRSHASNTG